MIFSRGNHDLRGNYAEKFAEYTPNSNGNTYYTFRLGRLWGIVLDCGEDKPDLMICGHFHDTAVWKPGGEEDTLGQPCNVVIGSDIDLKSGDFTGCGYIFGKESTEIIFKDNKGSISNPIRVI